MEFKITHNIPTKKLIEEWIVREFNGIFHV